MKQSQQQQHPFLHAHPSLDFAPAAAPHHHHHHHGYGTLPPGSLPPLAGLPGMQPAGRGPPTLLDRSHARMIPQVSDGDMVGTDLLLCLESNYISIDHLPFGEHEQKQTTLLQKISAE